MDNKSFRFAIKSVQEDGTFEGLAAVYSNVGLGADVIEPAAFQKTLAEKGGEVPLLWQHDTREPIGLGKLTDSSKGLVIHGELVLDSNEVAQKAYALLKRGVLRGLSIGYDEVKSRMVDGVRRISEMKLWEVLLVTFSMNPAATVTAVKRMDDVSDDIRNFREVLAECRKAMRE
jgi:uncharacterized protein